MRNLTASLLLSLATLGAQSATAPAWKEFSLGPSVKGNNRSSRDGIQANSMPLKRILSRAFGVPEHRIVGPTWVADESYALTALVNNPEDLRPLLQRELADRFSLLAHPETRNIPVLVLKPLAGVQPLSNQPSSPVTFTGGNPGLRLSRATFTDFAGYLADSLSRPVIDETHIDGHYDISFTWDRKAGAASIPDAAKQQLGIQAVEETRPIELLILDQIERPKLPH